MHSPDDENIIFRTAADFINNSSHPVFLTGKAGTGKTTFLKYIKENTSKNTAVVAPTGVAAINAGGTTIHSFFQLPFGPYIPVSKTQWGNAEVSDKQNLISKLRLTNERKEVMQQLELLIIDEISMVRCDVLDAIDAVLRHVRSQHHKPFGGVQVLYIGDMYQLPPVVKDEEWQILKDYYANQYFFSSHATVAEPPVYIELKKVYRQTDADFINLLNQVRNNEMDEGDYAFLHSRFLPNAVAKKEDNTITLTTHNNKADSINNDALASLQGKSFSFRAVVEGEFYEKSFPADELLQLKIGAQVMFIKNDTEKIRRYFNGKIGTVEKIENDKIFVICKDNDTSQTIEVRKETWRSIKYILDKNTQQIDEEELGSFIQYPLRLAWAITIHKSQGLTFEKAIIDAGSAFAPGQVYVAISRCVSLQGMILKSKISYNSLHSDERIVSFAKTQQSSEAQASLLEAAMATYQQDMMLGMIDFTKEGKLFTDLDNYSQQNSLGNAVAEWIKKLNLHFEIYIKNSSKFAAVLNGYFAEAALPEKNIALQERFGKAALWFFDELVGTKKLLLQSPAITDNRQLAKDYNNKLQLLFDAVCFKMHLLQSSKQGFLLTEYQKQKTNFKKESFTINAYSGRATYVPKDIAHPDLYAALKDKRDELCKELDLPVYMVCGSQSIADMCIYLPQTLQQLGNINGFGKIKLKQFGNDFISIIKDYASLHNLESQVTQLPAKKERKLKSTIPKPDTKLLSYDLYKQGKSMQEIAKERALTLTTIEGHLAHYVENGTLNIDELLDTKKQSEILKVFNNNRGELLQKIKDLLPAYSYCDIKLMMASEKYSASKSG
ncbi:MAG: helix-turn-helix domain-containing protein [Ferruginibacter sp.]